jgi:hypothetical protein
VPSWIKGKLITERFTTACRHNYECIVSV